MRVEIAAHHKVGTWELVKASSMDPGRRTIGSTWVFDIKRNKDGSIKRYKARLCAQGFSQIEGVDYVRTYYNTVRLDTLRTLFAVAAHLGLGLTSVDIVTAYLDGVLEEVLYMRQPDGFNETGPNGEAMVCNLKRGICGLKQS